LVFLGVGFDPSSEERRVAVVTDRDDKEVCGCYYHLAELSSTAYSLIFTVDNDPVVNARTSKRTHGTCERRQQRPWWPWSITRVVKEEEAQADQQAVDVCRHTGNTRETYLSWPTTRPQSSQEAKLKI
jgi:hypothetical protein